MKYALAQNGLGLLKGTLFHLVFFYGGCGEDHLELRPHQMDLRSIPPKLFDTEEECRRCLESVINAAQAWKKEELSSALYILPVEDDKVEEEARRVAGL